MTDWRVTVPDEVPDRDVDILEQVGEERGRQIAKWGDQSHRSVAEWLLILAEEFGEVSREVNELVFRGGDDTQQRELAARYRKEMVQVAAVAVAAISALDKQIGD